MGRRKNILDDKSFFLQFYEENKGFLFYTAQKYTSDAIVQEAINYIRQTEDIDVEEVQ